MANAVRTEGAHAKRDQRPAHPGDRRRLWNHRCVAVGNAPIDAYQALSPAQRAKVDRMAEARAEASRSERLKGTDCEELDALSCAEKRRQRKNLEAAACAWPASDMKKAYDDAGIR